MGKKVKLSQFPAHTSQKVTFRGVPQKSSQRLVWRGMSDHDSIFLQFFLYHQPVLRSKLSKLPRQPRQRRFPKQKFQIGPSCPSLGGEPIFTPTLL